MNHYLVRAGFHPRDWSWVKKTLMMFSILLFVSTSFMFLTPAGADVRNYLAGTVIMTQHREWAWIFVGKQQREFLVRQLQEMVQVNGDEPQQRGLIAIKPRRSTDQLIHVEDISGSGFKGKMMWVFDPKSIRLVVPPKPIDEKHQMGERITEMVKRTGAVAGVNAGGFDDPDGLGNGFAPIGMLMSDTQILYGAESGKQPIVGFTEDGFLVVGNYTLDELREKKVKEAASFYPRVILDGKALNVSSDGINPRTAVGQKADGTVIFIIIDGRQFGYSIGATLKQVQDLFLEQGVINAGFLDGGASSELVVDGQLITKPSSKYGERRLPSAFLVFDHPEDYMVVNPWKDITKIDPGGASTHPEFQADLQRQREQGVKEPAKSAAPTPSGASKSATATPKTSSEPAAKPHDSAEPGRSPVASVAPSGTPKDSGTSSMPTASGTPAAATPTASAAPTPEPTKQASPQGADAGAGSGTAGGSPVKGVEPSAAAK